jgi:uncharacterized damage-inducible protein DinB
MNMSQLTRACCTILDQLEDVIRQFSHVEFTRPSKTLSGSSIGQHLRHTLEFFFCLENGYGKGTVNYDKRAHDKRIEIDKEVAQLAIERIRKFIIRQVEDKPLLLEVGYDLGSNENVSVQTNYFRELTYNIEHAVHHMAIMKIGICELAPHVSIPIDFGVAASTLRYRGEIMAGAR